jgi:hypothetical protein
MDIIIIKNTKGESAEENPQTASTLASQIYQ